LESEQQDITELIKSEYLKKLLRTGQEPVTPFAFASELGIEEDDFFSRYNSFKALEKEIWLDIYDHVHAAISADVFKQNRSLVLFRLGSLPRHNTDPWFLEKFKLLYLDMMANLLSEAIESDEVMARPYVSDHYKDVLWIQALYISRVWANDDSEDHQITDAAIEKTVNLIFELMRKGPVDLMVDFAKFAYQNKAY
jgi:hypothetical protein